MSSSSISDNSSGNSDTELARLAWALAHPTRIRILKFLIKHGTCLCGDIVDHLPLAQSTVSQHLRILREAGLISGQEDDPRIHYSVVKKNLSRLKSLTQSL